jgi:hypothetical protein
MRNHPIIVATFALTAACGAADEHPLGGPFGGGANVAPPSAGAAQTTEGTVPSDQGDQGGQADRGDQGGSPDAGTAKQDAGKQSQDSGTQGPPPSPTWSSIYSKYLASGTPGDCYPCHSQMSTAPKAYSWLKQKGYINGTSSALVNPARSCLSWYGGNMPPQGPSSLPAAKSDMNAWVAAGAQNN